MITHAPSGLAGWIQAIRDADIPVLARTAAAVDAMREDEDDIAPRDIAGVVLDDPLMALKVLSHVARHRPRHVITDAETVTAALLMMGTGAFFRAFSGQATVEDRLGLIPGALDGLERVLTRSHRAARLAIGFAMHRLDTDAEVIQEAALLHDFAEALIWCHAPTLALEVQRLQLDDPALRSARAQSQVLGVSIRDLEQALMRVWRLPELLQHLTNDHLSRVPRVRNVLLATALARHSQRGWDNPAIPSDIEAIARLLNVSAGAAWGMIRELDETATEALPAC